MGVGRRASGVGRGAAGHIKQNVDASCTAKNAVRISVEPRAYCSSCSWQKDSESWGLGVFRVLGFGVLGVLLYFYVPYVARMALFLNLHSHSLWGWPLCYCASHGNIFLYISNNSNIKKMKQNGYLAMKRTPCAYICTYSYSHTVCVCGFVFVCLFVCCLCCTGVQAAGCRSIVYMYM